ncbi:hypothetical protein IID10_10585 [candidate division KSB1 bacterium]|nr:hypothetical protein [candidate division KSB1 bacterium]
MTKGNIDETKVPVRTSQNSFENLVIFRKILRGRIDVEWVPVVIVVGLGCGDPNEY